MLLDQHEEQNGGFLVQLVELVLDECLDSVVSNESPAPVEQDLVEAGRLVLRPQLDGFPEASVNYFKCFLFLNLWRKDRYVEDEH